MKSTLQLLIDGRAFIARGWTAYYRGKTVNGKPIEGRNPHAVQWCALGALDAAADQDDLSSPWFTAIPDRNPAILLLASLVPGSPYSCPQGLEAARVATYNNNNTNQASVLNLFDRAIASLQPARAVIAKAQDTDLITNEIQDAGILRDTRTAALSDV